MKIILLLCFVFFVILWHHGVDTVEGDSDFAHVNYSPIEKITYEVTQTSFLKRLSKVLYRNQSLSMMFGFGMLVLIAISASSLSNSSKFASIK